MAGICHEQWDLPYYTPASFLSTPQHRHSSELLKTHRKSLRPHTTPSGTMMDMEIDLPPANTFQSFPDDVLGRVIDFSSREDQIAWSLVSKVMRKRALFHIFRLIDIDPGRISKKFRKGLRDLWEFLLQEPAPDGANFIEAVDIEVDDDDEHQVRTISSTEISLLMNRCPKLNHITLENVSVHYREGPVSREITRIPPLWPVNGYSIDSLAIGEVFDRNRWYRAQDLVEILSCFKQINELHLNLKLFGGDYTDDSEPDVWLLAEDADYTVAVDCLPAELEIRELWLFLPVFRADELVSSLCRAICHTRTAQTLEKLHISLGAGPVINIYNIFKASALKLKDITLHAPLHRIAEPGSEWWDRTLNVQGPY